MAINKVVYGGDTLIDLTGDTVTAAKMLSGTKAHDKSGAAITGTIPSQAAKTVTPTTSSQTAVASGRYTTGAITVAAIPSKYQDITTPLAELNAANGGTAASTMAGAVDNTEALASSQETLIAQIATALEGKAAGGGGSVETCTVTLRSMSYAFRPYYYSYTTFDSMEIVSKAVSNNSSSEVILENVVCGSVVTVYWYDASSGYQLENASLLAANGKYFSAFQITASAGEEAEIYAQGRSGGSG